MEKLNMNSIEIAICDEKLFQVNFLLTMVPNQLF